MKIEILPWLERFSAARCPHLSNVLNKTALIDEEAIHLIKFSHLSERQLSNLGKQLVNVPANLLAASKRFHLGVVSNFNVDLLRYPLIASGLRYDRLFKVTLGLFDNVAQEALNPHSGVKFNTARCSCNFVGLSFFWRMANSNKHRSKNY